MTGTIFVINPNSSESVTANIAKRYFLRNRPWAIDPKLVACDYKPNAAPLTM